jgi:hypothetical protein
MPEINHIKHRLNLNSIATPLNRTISVAPMLDSADRLALPIVL